jgi:hypothetical protein
MTSADSLQMPRRHSLAGTPSVLFIASMATFVQSFVAIKLAFITLFVFAAIVDGAFRAKIRVHPRLVYFYLVIAIIGIIWAFIGLLNPETYFVGVTDSVRLYAVWSAAFLLLYTLLRSQSSLLYIHRALVAAGIFISLVNFAGILDQLGQYGLFPESASEELNQKIEFYEGVIRIASRNIGSLFFLVPYLIAVQVRSDSPETKSITTKLSLVLCLILSAVSGRRALDLLVALTPFTVLVVAALSGNLGLIKLGARRLFLAYTIAVALGMGALIIQPEFLTDILYVQHVEGAFSTTDERTIQKPFLVEGFESSPIIGLGFGSAVRYQRNQERPWIYELTYYQILLNAGVIGATILSVLFLYYGVLIVDIFRRFKTGSVIPFGLLVGVISLLIGASSNPYLGSFDLLFFLGFVPFLSTFRGGFVPIASAR